MASPVGGTHSSPFPVMTASSPSDRMTQRTWYGIDLPPLSPHAVLLNACTSQRYLRWRWFLAMLRRNSDDGKRPGMRSPSFLIIVTEKHRLTWFYLSLKPLTKAETSFCPLFDSAIYFVFIIIFCFVFYFFESRIRHLDFICLGCLFGERETSLCLLFGSMVFALFLEREKETPFWLLFSSVSILWEQETPYCLLFVSVVCGWLIGWSVALRPQKQ